MDPRNQNTSVDSSSPSVFSRTSTTRSDHDGEKMTGQLSGSCEPRRKEAKGSLLSRLKHWITTSEPSSQALSQHKKDTYKKAGIPLDDPKANAKLHAPLGGIPEEAIKATGSGPEPEEMIKKRAEQRRKRVSYGHLGQASRSSQSYSSHSGSTSSIKDGYFTFVKPDRDQ